MLELMRDIVAMIPVDRRAAEKKSPIRGRCRISPSISGYGEKGAGGFCAPMPSQTFGLWPTTRRSISFPKSSHHEAVPTWRLQRRRSGETLSSADDPLYYEISFTQNDLGKPLLHRGMLSGTARR